MTHPKRVRLGIAAAALVSVGAAGGIAGGTAATKKSPASRSADDPGRPPFGGSGLHRGGPDHFAVHESAVVLDQAGKAYITATGDTGTVDSVAGEKLSIKEGTTTVPYKTVTVTVPSGAKVYRNGATAKLGDLKTGDRVHVSQSSDGTVVFAGDGSRGGPWDHGRGGRDRDGRDGPPPFGPPPGM